MSYDESISRLTGVGPLTVLIKPEGDLAPDLAKSLSKRPTVVLRPGMLDTKYRGEQFFYRGGVLLTPSLFAKYRLPGESPQEALLRRRFWLKVEKKMGPRDQTTIDTFMRTFLHRGQTIRIDGEMYTIAEAHAPVIRTGPSAGESLPLIPVRTETGRAYPRYQTTITLVLDRGKTSPGLLDFGKAACRRRKQAMAADYDTVFVEPKRVERRRLAEERAKQVRAKRGNPASPTVASEAPALSPTQQAAQKAREAAARRARKTKAGPAARTKGGGTGGKPRARRRTKRRKHRKRHTYKIRRHSRRKRSTRGRGMHLKSIRRRLRS